MVTVAPAIHSSFETMGVAFGVLSTTTGSPVLRPNMLLLATLNALELIATDSPAESFVLYEK